MIVPAQPTSSSASASGQAVTIAKDTVTTGTSVTGLAGVLAEADAEDVAAQIVQAVSSHVPAPAQKDGQDSAQNEIREIRVIGDLSTLGDIATLKILAGQVTQLNEQITAYVSSVPKAAPPTGRRLKIEAVVPGRFEPEFEADLVGTWASADLLGTLATVVSQLVTGTYAYSGQAIPNASIGGLDILIARKLTPKTSVPVRVDRFGAMSADNDILTHIQDLAAGS
jgi:hypothetical protein